MYFEILMMMGKAKRHIKYFNFIQLLLFLVKFLLQNRMKFNLNDYHKYNQI